MREEINGVDDRDAPRPEGLVEDLRSCHASESEVERLVGSFVKARTLRALSHLGICSLCRERLSARIEEVVLDEQREVGDAAPLVRFLHHEEPLLRVAAIEAASTLELDTTILDSFATLLEDPHADVRVAAVRGFGRLQDVAPLVVDRLVMALHDSASAVRAAAATAVGRIGSVAEALAEGLIVPLLGRLRDDDPEVVAAARNAVSLVVTATSREVFGKARIRPSLAGALAGNRHPSRIVDSEKAFQSVSVRQDDEWNLIVHVACHSSLLDAFAIVLFVGNAWRATKPLEPSKQVTWLDTEDWVDATFTLTREERKKLPLNAVLHARVVASTDAT